VTTFGPFGDLWWTLLKFGTSACQMVP
jgi:hypothetical protein